MTNQNIKYGKELIIDLEFCNPELFNRRDIERYFIELCELINMTRCDLHFWDDLDVPEDQKQTSPKTKGTSAIQFIITSNITIHTLDLLKQVYVNIFSCKEFDEYIAADFTERFFQGEYMTYSPKVMVRGTAF